MPPEYIDRNEITSKYDVFSLGVIITEIITGCTAPTVLLHLVSIS